MHALLPSNDNLKESSAKVVAVFFSLHEKSETGAKFYAYKSLYFLFFIRTTPHSSVGMHCVVTVQHIKISLLVKFLIYTPAAILRGGSARPGIEPRPAVQHAGALNNLSSKF